MDSNQTLELINNAWALVEPKPKYNEVNFQFPVVNIKALTLLEEKQPKLGLAHFATYQEHLENKGGIGGMTWLSLLATITDCLCDRRLAACVDEEGRITKWQWYDAIDEVEG